MSQIFTDNCYDSTHQVATDMAAIENNFAALKSMFSGAAAPSDLVAGMWWFDTTAHILKVRNEDNNAWLSVWDLANNKPVITNLSNEITGAMIAAAAKDPVAGTAGLRTLGTGAQQACGGTDVRLVSDGDKGSITVSGSNTVWTLDSATVTQSKLATSMGSVNTVAGANLTLPGGEYGFYPQTKGEGIGAPSAQIRLSGIGTSYTTNIYLIGDGGSNAYAQQRYVTSSGEIFWLFILRDKQTGDIISMWQSPDHPCFGNGGKPNLLQHPFADVKENRWLGNREIEIIIVNPAHDMVQEAMFRRIAIEGGYPDKSLYQKYINKTKREGWKGALRTYEAQSKLKAKHEQEAREFLLDYQGFIIDENRPNRDLLEVFKDNYELGDQVLWGEKVCTVALPDEDLHGSSVVDWRMIPAGTLIAPIKARIMKPQDIKLMNIKLKAD